jgi:hypothetical protein
MTPSRFVFDLYLACLAPFPPQELPERVTLETFKVPAIQWFVSEGPPKCVRVPCSACLLSGFRSLDEIAGCDIPPSTASLSPGAVAFIEAVVKFADSRVGSGTTLEWPSPALQLKVSLTCCLFVPYPLLAQVASPPGDGVDSSLNFFRGPARSSRLH